MTLFIKKSWDNLLRCHQNDNSKFIQISMSIFKKMNSVKNTILILIILRGQF